jgi:predicted dehydrogenase
MKKTGIGLLGAGMISSLHAEALRHSRKTRLAAISDLDARRARKLADDCGAGVVVHGTLQEMLANPEVEAVCVATPNHLHTESVLACIRAGKHVLCEKPPALSLSETDRMIAAAAESGLMFGVFVQCRLRPVVAATAAAIAAGRFGRILRIDAVMPWFRSQDYYHMDAWRKVRAAGAGVTIQHAFHYIDLLVHLGGAVESLCASMRNMAHADVELEDTLDALLCFRSGATGSMRASTALWPGADAKIEVYGERGSVVMKGAAFEVWRFREEIPEDASIRLLGDADQVTGGSSPVALDYADHMRVYDDLADAIAGDRDVAIPCSSVRPTLEVALAMYLSDAQGSPVSLPLVGVDGIQCGAGSPA